MYKMMRYDLSNQASTQPMTPEASSSSQRHSVLIVTGRKLKAPAVNATGTWSPTDTSVSIMFIRVTALVKRWTLFMEQNKHVWSHQMFPMYLYK